MCSYSEENVRIWHAPFELRKANNFIISNEEIDENMKTVKSVEESGLLIKSFSETIKNEVKEQKRGFLGMLIGTLGVSFVSLLENLIIGKGTIRAAEDTVTAVQHF